jgi:hypothetical protein
MMSDELVFFSATQFVCIAAGPAIGRIGSRLRASMRVLRVLQPYSYCALCPFWLPEF